MSQSFVCPLRIRFPLVYFALVESGMLLSFCGLSLQGESGTISVNERDFTLRVVAAPLIETAFALATVVLPFLALVHAALPAARSSFELLYTGYALFCAALVAGVGCTFPHRAARRPTLGGGWRTRFFACAALAAGANVTQQGFYISTASEQFAWRGQEGPLLAAFNWGFSALALPSMFLAAKLEEKWHEDFSRGARRGYVLLAALQASRARPAKVEGFVYETALSVCASHTHSEFSFVRSQVGRALGRAASVAAAVRDDGALRAGAAAGLRARLRVRRVLLPARALWLRRRSLHELRRPLLDGPLETAPGLASAAARPQPD